MRSGYTDYHPFRLGIFLHKTRQLESNRFPDLRFGNARDRVSRLQAAPSVNKLETHYELPEPIFSRSI